MEQDLFSRESRNISYRSIFDRLHNRNLIHSYDLDTAQFKQATIGASFYTTKNLVTNFRPGWVIKSQLPQENVNLESNLTTLDAKIKANRDKKDFSVSETIKEEGGMPSLRNRFFFLGDLMWTLLDRD